MSDDIACVGISMLANLLRQNFNVYNRDVEDQLFPTKQNLFYLQSLQREIEEYRQLLNDGEYSRAPRSRIRSPERVIKHVYYEPVTVSVPSPVHSPYRSPHVSPRYSPYYSPYRPYSTYSTEYTTYRRPRSLSPVRSDYKNYRDEVVVGRSRTPDSGCL